MENFNWSFDARSVEPQQSGRRHPPVNKIQFSITDAGRRQAQDGKSQHLAVDFTSDMGTVTNRYNLWHENPVTVDIAKKQLSALCHATGIFNVGPRDGKELIGGRGIMDVGFQAGQEPTPEKPEGGFTQVTKVYDLAGNEPGKAPAPQQNNGFVQQPQPQSGFQPQPTTGAVPQQQPAQGWQPAPQQPQQNVTPNQGGWQQQPAGGPAAQAPWNRNPNP